MLLIFAVVIVVAVIALKIFLPEEPSEKEIKSLYNYKRKDFLISRPEHEFFDILVEVVGNQYYVFPQVHLDAIVYPQKYSGKRVFPFRHINQKSVDFVICDKAYIKPLLAIELDDRTHEREDRKERDVEVERILREAEFPLLRVGNSGHFDKEEIKRLVSEKLSKK